jgi:uncharacterized protein DUF2852
MSTAARADDYPRGPWAEYNRFKHPGWIILMVLAFIAWWPIGLAVLAFMLWNRSCGRSSERWQEKMERVRDKMEHFGGGGWRGPPSSGNHAFDEYRTETLRRLEDEQREFREFLHRLRFAKDKAEFDQFMAERRNRPEPQAPQPQS